MMQRLITILLVILFCAAIVICAQISVDRMTARDCARGIKAACEEVERLNLR